MEEGLLSLFAAQTAGGVSSERTPRGDRDFLRDASASSSARASSSVFRDEIARPNHSRADVAAAVSMLRAAAARRNPDDPDAALRAALEVAGEGDATLIREALWGDLQLGGRRAGERASRSSERRARHREFAARAVVTRVVFIDFESV